MSIAALACIIEGMKSCFISAAAFESNHQHRRRQSWLLNLIPTLQVSEPPKIVLQTFASSLYSYLIFSSYGCMVSRSNHIADRHHHSFSIRGGCTSSTIDAKE